MGPADPSVLVVDDEAAVRGALQAALQAYGFAVWTAANGAEALDVYARHRGAIGAVLLDVRMPGLDGPQTLAGLRRLDPQVRCCFMSGDPGRYGTDELLGRGARHVFAKPLRLEEVAGVLRQLID
jgi:CheY-like chemotaxis protein